MKKLLQLYQGYKQWLVDNKARPTLCFDDRGFSITHPCYPAVNLQWSDVKEIWIYKRDCITVDQICVSFISAEGMELITTEDMLNYRVFCEHLTVAFPNIESRWYENVIFPPFETNLAKIWEKTIT